MPFGATRAEARRGRGGEGGGREAGTTTRSGEVVGRGAGRGAGRELRLGLAAGRGGEGGGREAGTTTRSGGGTKSDAVHNGGRGRGHGGHHSVREVKLILIICLDILDRRFFILQYRRIQE